jgi:hypothetical protein
MRLQHRSSRMSSRMMDAVDASQGMSRAHGCAPQPVRCWRRNYRCTSISIEHVAGAPHQRSKAR